MAAMCGSHTIVNSQSIEALLRWLMYMQRKCKKNAKKLEMVMIGQVGNYCNRAPFQHLNYISYRLELRILVGTLLGTATSTFLLQLLCNYTCLQSLSYTEIF